MCMDIERAAAEAVGNWHQWPHFVWDREAHLPDPDHWHITYTHHRDSGLLQQSNASVVRQELAAFLDGEEGDVLEEDHAHPLFGWLRGFAIRVYDARGEVTEAFRRFAALQERVQQYPVLDEADYAERAHEAAVEHVTTEGGFLVRHDPPEDWAEQVLTELSRRGVSGVDDGDRGAWFSEREITGALKALGLLAPEYMEGVEG